MKLLAVVTEAKYIDAGSQTVVPADLGWSHARHESARRYARALRDRYTFLDLASDAGRFGPYGGGSP